MARCGCTGTTCSCKIVGEGGIVVSGAGTITNPYRISGGIGMSVTDSATVNFTLLGSGSSTDPYLLTADVDMGIGDLNDVDTSGGTAGDVIALQGDGSYALVPPATAAPGLIATGLALEGDGSSGDPLNVRLGSLSGLEIVASGLRVVQHTVTDESGLTAFGALPAGSIVTDTDGLNAWIKTGSGWQPLVEDSGTIATVSGNITDVSGWDVDSLTMRRRNGIVHLSVVMTHTSGLITAIDTGNVANFDIATIVPSEFRPLIPAPLRVTGAGPDLSLYIATNGVIWVTNYPAADVTFPAGEQFSFAGVYLGA